MVHVMIAVLSLLAAVCVAVTLAQPAGQTNLPGLTKGPGAQCEEHLSNSTAVLCGFLMSGSDPIKIKPETYCTELICSTYDLDSDEIRIGHKFGPALDGTWCGWGKICVNESCVNRTERAYLDASRSLYCQPPAESSSDNLIGKDA